MAVRTPPRRSLSALAHDDEERGAGADRSSAGGSVRSAVTNADEYRSAIRGVTIDTVRAGLGAGPNRVVSRAADEVAATSVSFGYPVVSHSVAPKGQIVMATFDPVPGAQWVGHDLEPHTVMAYGSDAEHVAVNPEGLTVRFIVVGDEALVRAAEAMEISIATPPPGQVWASASHRSARRLSRAIADALVAVSPSGRVRADTEVVGAAAFALAGPDAWEDARSTRGIDSRTIVGNCVDFAESVGRIPSTIELCEAAHVSERRLRSAFAELYSMPPTAFFRMWVLAKADHRLRSQDHHPGSVTRVALDLGISHLGRFAARYRDIYGTSPSKAATG